jgi:alpha-amylase
MMRVSLTPLLLIFLSFMSVTCGGGAAQAPVLPKVDARIVEPVELRPVSRVLPNDWKHGTFMEIYVRGYQDSDGDGVGDLKGLISRLDYLQSLGVSGIWLMPITASQDDDHGYAVTDYRAIEPEYGTLADFDELIAQAHRRGIGVIMDYVINHSAAEHPLFESSRTAINSPYRDWYVWKDKKPSGWNIYGKDPWYEDDTGAYFSAFWDQMPDFNLKNPKVLSWHQDNLKFWLNRGIDGFRFDAVGNLVENGSLAWEAQEANHAIMKSVQDLLGQYGDRYMVCEAPGDPLAFGMENSCGSSFAFGHNQRIVAAALGDPSAIEYATEYFSKPRRMRMSPFVSNHDAFAGQRLWDRMRGDEARYRLAAATYLLQSIAPPFVYYGEEIGMAGAAKLGGDHKLRTPMSWSAETAGAGFTTAEPFRALSANHASRNVATQIQDPTSLWTFYRDVIHLRQEHVVLHRGDYVNPVVDGWVASFQRVSPGNRALLVFNYGEETMKAVAQQLPPKAKLQRVWPHYSETMTADANGRVEFVVPGLSFAVFEVVE